jgi:hypothetical protein
MHSSAAMVAGYLVCTTGAQADAAALRSPSNTVKYAIR